MTATKTKRTGASVDTYLSSRANPEQLTDCKAIMAMCKRVTKHQPKMWGPSIVGYGSYTYRYESGHSGDACLTGFAVRGKELVVYLIAENPEQVNLLGNSGDTRWVRAACTSSAWRTSMSKSLRHSLPGRSQKSNAAIRTPATPNHSFNRTRYGRPQCLVHRRVSSQPRLFCSCSFALRSSSLRVHAKVASRSICNVGSQRSLF